MLRNGEELLRSDTGGTAEGPATWAPGRYELRVESQQDAPSTALNTRQRISWSFDWTDREAPAPILAVRYDAGLDEYNRAKGGTTHPLTVWVDRTTTAGEVRDLAVQVSYDDGRNWAPVTLTKDDPHWTAQLNQPANASFVSLRATASDAAGNTVTQEVIRAYALSD